MKPTKDDMIYNLDDSEVKLFQIMFNKKMSEKFDWFIGSEFQGISFKKFSANPSRNFISSVAEIFVDEKWGRQQVDSIFGESEGLTGFGLGDIIDTNLSLKIQTIMFKIFAQVTGQTPKYTSFSWMEVIFVDKPKKDKLEESIKRVLKEESDNSLSDKLKTLSDKIGLSNAAKTVGGLNNYIQIVYDGDIKEFFKNENIKPYYIREGNEVNMYFDDNLVQHLNLEDFGEDEKKLGKFKFGMKNNTQYSFDARLRKVNHVTGKVVWRVVGMSGSHGFGYSGITKRETLGKTYRMQIFKQIVDKYNLEDYK